MEQQPQRRELTEGRGAIYRFRQLLAAAYSYGQLNGVSDDVWRAILPDTRQPRAGAGSLFTDYRKNKSFLPKAIITQLGNDGTLPAPEQFEAVATILEASSHATPIPARRFWTQPNVIAPKTGKHLMGENFGVALRRSYAEATAAIAQWPDIMAGQTLSK